MIIKNLTQQLFITHNDNHNSVKDICLDNIHSNSIYSVKNDNISVYNTNWHINRNKQDGVYFTTLCPFIYEIHYKEIYKHIPFKDTEIITYWYNQYKKGDHHPWHIHNGNYTNIYYLDLPSGTAKTSIRTIDGEFDLEVKEGDCVTFPSSVYHCSKPNPVDDIKTIIAWNSIHA